MAVLQRFWSRAICEKPKNQDLGMLGTGKGPPLQEIAN